MSVVEFPGGGHFRRCEELLDKEAPSNPRRKLIRERCSALASYEKVCALTDEWAGSVPGVDADREIGAEIDHAYDVFHRATATSLEGLRLQFENLIAATDVEGDLNPHPRVLELVRSMRAGFETLEAKGGGPTALVD